MDWQAKPRPAAEFFRSFQALEGQKKWLARAKCNVYYYRTNYLLILLASLLFFFFRNPASLVAIASAVFSLLLLNDTFATGFSDKAMKAVRKANPALAMKLRTAAGASGQLGTPGTRRFPRVRICGFPRHKVVAGAGACSALLIYITNTLFTLAYALVLASALILAHASFRTHNFKARLANAREDFRAVWRGYSDGVNDYTL